MPQDMKENGKICPFTNLVGLSELISERAEESKCGLMVLSTKVGGRTTKPTEKED